MQLSKDRFDRDQGTVLLVDGQPMINAEWKSARHLVITCHCARREVFKEVIALGDIDVSYE